MKTLVIKDLSVTETMDGRAAARVHGGTMVAQHIVKDPGYPIIYGPFGPLPLPIEFPVFPPYPGCHPIDPPGHIQPL